MIAFSICDWAAWAPSLSTRSQWQAWAQAPVVPHGDQLPALTGIPSMVRRRMNAIAKMTAEVLLHADLTETADEDVSWIFASRHGEVVRSIELLQSVVDQVAMSPIGFGLSVHNAAPATCSILSQFKHNYLALAGAQATVENACIEAFGLIEDGCKEVRIVCCDVPLPSIYQAFVDEPQASFGWCWRVRAAGADGIQMSLAWSQAVAPLQPCLSSIELPALLLPHQFLLSDARSLSRQLGGQMWQWVKHA